MDKILDKIDRIFIFVIIYTFLFITFINTLGYTLPFVLGLLFAFILQYPTNFLINKFKLKNSIAALISTTIFSAIIFIFLIWGIVLITSEVTLFTRNSQAYIVQILPKANTQVENLHTIYKNLDPTILNSIDKNVSDYASKTLSTTVNISGKIMSFIFNLISNVPYIIMVILFALLATYFFTKDLSNARIKFLNTIPQNKSDRIIKLIKETKKMLMYYFLSCFIFIAITFIETLIAFLFLGVSSPFILSIITGICDIVPIIGVGVIYLPLSLIYFLSGNYFIAIGLIITFVLISLIRQIISPKVISSTLGLDPLASLIALFIGLKAAGVTGMFYGIFLLVFYNILKNLKII